MVLPSMDATIVLRSLDSVIRLLSQIYARLSASAWDNEVVSRVRELEQRLERTEQQLRLLQKISRYLVRQTKLQDALDGVVTLVVEFMECDSCLLYLLDNHELVLRAGNRPSAVGNVKLAMNEGLTGWVAREKRLLAISREAFRDPRFKFFSDLPEDTYEAFLSAPVLSRRGVEGVINVQHRDPHSHYRNRNGAAHQRRRAAGLFADALANRDGGE